MGTSLKLSHFRLVMLLLALGTIIVFARALTCGFVFDDSPYVVRNEHVNTGIAIKNLVWSLTGVHGANWHPLTWMSHMVDVSMYRMRPAGHHATNLIFHVANVLLLLLILSKMTGSLWKSAFVAALFAIHPLHIESVAWVTERKDVLSTFFWLLTMLAYAHYVEKPDLRRYGLVILAFVLGLASKPMLVTLPFVLLLLDYWPLSRVRLGEWRWSLIREKAPLFALSAASSVITFFAQRHEGAVVSGAIFPLWARAANALVSYASYIGKMLLPIKLAVYYPHPAKLPVWLVVIAVLVLAGITILIVKGARRYPFLAVGWLWYIGTLIPVIGLVQVGGQAMADRYTYVPLIGLFIIAAWGVPEILVNLRKNDLTNVYPMLAGVVLLPLMISTVYQLGYWKSDITLFSHALAVTRNNQKAHYNLATAYLDAGKLDAAILHYRKSLSLNDNDADAHCNLGTALYRKGRIMEAIEEYYLAIGANPKYATAHYNLAVALQKIGRMQEAEFQYLQAISINPRLKDIRDPLAQGGSGMSARPDPGNRPQEHFDRGIAFARQEKFAQAEVEFREVVRLDPAYAEGHANLGTAYNAQGKWDKAITELTIALSMKPELGAAHYNMAVALFAKGDYAGSWEHVRQAEKLGMKPQSPFIQALTEKMPRPR